ncbi:MAG: hypothetical protein QOJ64_1122 [Acidobacteriota bacterium]|nr:hypothetical protein [Acidobacteriota bacterium]
MTKRSKITKGSTPRVRRLRLPAIIAAIAVLAIGAVTVVSRQMAKVGEKTEAQGGRSLMANAPNKNYVTVKVAGRDVHVDSQTGQIQELSPEDAAKLAAGLHELVNQSTDGLHEEIQSDGSVKMDLEGHFSNVVVARENGDGTLEQSCVDNPKSAGAFFGIDPKQIENPSASREPSTQRPRLTPARTQDK